MTVFQLVRLVLSWMLLDCNDRIIHCPMHYSTPLPTLTTHTSVHSKQGHHNCSASTSLSSSHNRHYKYGRPPALPNAKNPNPMVSKSSTMINRKHARYVLTAGMMLGIRESVSGALGWRPSWRFQIGPRGRVAGGRMRKEMRPALVPNSIQLPNTLLQNVLPCHAQCQQSTTINNLSTIAAFSFSSLAFFLPQFDDWLCFIAKKGEEDIEGRNE